MPFDPSVNVQSGSQSSDSPGSLSVDVDLPQPQNPTGITESNLKKAVVTLPEGTSINPSAADGLAGCTESQFGVANSADPSCPAASKIGNVEIASPLQPDPLQGAIYQATPNQNPFGSLLAIYVVAQGGGVTVKLTGEIATDPQTGQITATIDNAPQLPFSHFGLNFFGGARAALATPVTCGTKTATARLSSWSRPNAQTTLTDSFSITSGPGGSACAATPGARPFTPSLAAGLVNPASGSPEPVQPRGQPSRRQPGDLDHRREPARGRLGGARLGTAVRRGPGRGGHLRRFLAGGLGLGQGRRRHQPVPDHRRLGLHRRPL